MFTRSRAVIKFIHLGDILQRPRWLQRWEEVRYTHFHWLVECIGEAMGVYFFVYCGAGANSAFTVGNLANLAGIGSLQTVALGYGLGIAMAISVAAPMSGGHFNPAVTISQAVWKGFPWKKVPQYIIAQTLGAFLACLAVYLQYRTTFNRIEEALIAVGQYDAVQFTPNGIAGIFAPYTPRDAYLWDVFANEFFADFYLGLVIWGVVDVTNFHVPPASAPWVIGLAYGSAIWAFGPASLSANTARDLGGRMMALIVWGKPSLTLRYTFIASLTNIPATLLATLIYELFSIDSGKVIPRAHQEVLSGRRAHRDYYTLTPELHQLTTLNHVSTHKADFVEAERVA